MSCVYKSEKIETILKIKVTNTTYLEFEKRVNILRNHIEGHSSDSYDTFLWYHQEGKKRLVVDKQMLQKPVYSKILYANDSTYSLFPTKEKYRLYKGKKDRSERIRRIRSWDITVNPDNFSLNEYWLIKNALEKNLEKINKSLSEKIIKSARKDLFSRTAIPYLNSIIYKKYNYYYFQLDDENAKIYFWDQNKSFALVLSPPNSIYLEDFYSGQRQSSSYLGSVNERKGSCEVRLPFPNVQKRWGLEDFNSWFKIYRSCKDKKGKSIFDYYKVEYWNYAYEK